MSDEHDPDDRSEILFLALTRPALLWGVPYEAFFLNAVGTMFAGMIFSSTHTLWRSPFMFWACGYPIHKILQRMTAWDFHGFRSLRLWLETAAIGRNRLEAISTEAPKTARDIPSSV